MVAVLRLASDQRLAEWVAAGSESAFEVLYDRHHRPVLSFCRHMLGSLDEAEDALQHTFMSAYRDLLRSGPPAAVRPWLFVIARNRCISVLRARRELPAETVPERASDRLALDVAVREELRAVFAGLTRLPDDQRAALVLSELGDFSHDEIARILDCRREQVKSYVFQARSALAADRVARNTPCAEIREQLSAFRGAQLRRNALRRHLDGCAGCREFRETLRSQRRQLRALLPVAPGLGLKRAVLGAVLAGGGGGAGTIGGLAATALIVIAIPVGGVATARNHALRRPVAPTIVAASGVSAAVGGAADASVQRWTRSGAAGARPDPSLPGSSRREASWVTVPGPAYDRDRAPADHARSRTPSANANAGDETPPGRASGRDDTPPGGANGPDGMPPGGANGRADTPPGRANGRADTPPGRANGRADTPPRRANGRADTPPRRANGRADTPPGRANGRDKAPAGDRGRTNGRQPAPAGGANGHDETPAGDGGRANGRQTTVAGRTNGHDTSPRGDDGGARAPSEPAHGRGAAPASGAGRGGGQDTPTTEPANGHGGSPKATLDPADGEPASPQSQAGASADRSAGPPVTRGTGGG
jgi:RNA polymerase sigma factor (sigma-70 family)